MTQGFPNPDKQNIRRPQVLYIDDDPSLLEITRSFLEKNGELHVDIEGIPSEGLKRISQGVYDAVISDYQMPEMDGLELLRRLRSCGNDTPFILFTGKGREEVVIEALNSGADFYLQKGGDPIAQFTELEYKIKEMVRRYQAERDLRDSEARLRKAQDISKTGAVEITWTPDGETTVWGSEEAFAIFGIPRPPTGFIPLVQLESNVVDGERTLKGFLELLNGRKDYDQEIEITPADGGPHKIIHTNFELGNKDEGKFRKIIGAIHDVTDYRRNEETFFKAFHCSMAAMSLSRLSDGKYIEVNDRWLEYNEWNREEVIGQSSQELGIWADEHDRQRIVNELKSKGSFINKELKQRKKNGDVWTALCSAQLVSICDEEVILVSTLDISQRKREEEELIASKEKLAMGMDLAKMAYWEYDGLKDQFHFDERFYALYETTAEREGGYLMTPWQYVSSFVPPEEDQVVLDFILNGIYNEGNNDYPQIEHRIIRRDGELRHIVVRIHVIRDESGLAVKVYGVNQDITDQILARKKLEQSEEKFARAFSANAAGMIITRADDVRVIEVNDTLLKMSGTTREEVINKSLFELNFWKDQEQRDGFLQDLRERGTLCGQEMEFMRGNGEKCHFLISAQFMTLSGEEFLLSSAIDITKQKEIEEALRVTNQHLSLLAGVTGHDINNQLVALKGNIDLVKRRVTDSAILMRLSKIEWMVSKIWNQIEFTKGYSQQGSSLPRWQTVGEFFEDPLTYEDAKWLELSEDVGHLELFADPMIEKVFHNLVENSIKYGGKRISIKIHCHRCGDKLVLVYEDDGQGIPLDEKERIFEKGSGKGTGLGLFLSREILAITGITIKECGEPGIRAKFEMIVPSDCYRLGKGNERHPIHCYDLMSNEVFQ